MYIKGKLDQAPERIKEAVGCQRTGRFNERGTRPARSSDRTKSQSKHFVFTTELNLRHKYCLQKETEELMIKLENDQKAVNEVAAIVSAEEEKMRIETEMVRNYAQAAEKDLDDVVPVVINSITFIAFKLLMVKVIIFI